MDRKKELYNLWNRKEWKEKRDEFIKTKGGKCEWCGSEELLTVHHLSHSTYDKKEEYLDLKEEENIVLCRKCHFAIYNNLELCHICHEKYHKTDYLSCFNCKAKAFEDDDMEKEIDEGEEKMFARIEADALQEQKIKKVKK